MNTRIKELAEQAGVDAGQLFAEMLCNDSDVNVKIAEAWNAQPDDVRQRIFQVIEQKQEKFAELIVRECTTLLFNESERLYEYSTECDNMRESDEAEVVAEKCVDLITMIEQHFGVER